MRAGDVSPQFDRLGPPASPSSGAIKQSPKQKATTVTTLRRNAALALLTLALFGCAEPQPQITTTTAWVILTFCPKAF